MPHFVNYREFRSGLECDFRHVFEDVLVKKLGAPESDQEVKFDQEKFFASVKKLFFSGENDGSLEDIKASAFIAKHHEIVSNFINSQDVYVSLGMMYNEPVDEDKHLFIHSNLRVLTPAKHSSPADLRLVDFIFTSQPKSSISTVLFYNQKRIMDILSFNPHACYDWKGKQVFAPVNIQSDNIEYIQIIIPTCKTSKTFNPNDPIVFVMNLSADDRKASNINFDLRDEINKFASIHAVKKLFVKEIAEEDIFPNPYIENRSIRQCQSGHHTCRFIEHCPIVNLRITKM